MVIEFPHMYSTVVYELGITLSRLNIHFPHYSILEQLSFLPGHHSSILSSSFVDEVGAYGMGSTSTW